MLRPVRSKLVKAFPVRFTYALIVADAATGMLIAAGLPPKGAESVTAFQASCWRAPPASLASSWRSAR